MNNDKMQKLTAQLMEQAQVFASSWSLFGGPFDDGSALIDAEEARAELNSMIRDALSAATGWQESEAQAVAKVTVGNADHGPFRFEETPYGFDRLPDGETYLFAAPPSTLAIETAALRKAAEVLEGWAETAEAFGFDGDAKNYRDIKAEILATIPQDGITELERFGMRVAQEVCKGDLQDGDIRSIVTSLIASPTLDKE